MLSLKWKFGALLAFLLAGTAWGQTTYNCLPTCSSTDARFLVIANGASFFTLSQPTLDLEIGVPKGTTSFTVGVFDGDAKGTDAGGVAHWDTGSSAVFTYTLYADPNRDHAAAVVAPLSGLPAQLSTTMPDNAWIDYSVTTNPSAQAPSGNYFYLLRIQLTTPVTIANAFKIRTGGAIVGGSSLFPSPSPFSYIANIAGNADIAIVYPAFPSLTPTTYDGYFNFYFEQPVSSRDITVWDGDFDHGKFDGTDKDTDDPDTPNAPFRPSWATADTVSEGVATGLSGSTGNPPDDRNPAGQGIYLLKPPSIRYDLIFPDGQTFANDNPSGNQEWEQFKISTDPFDRSQMDYHTNVIPPGTYQVRIQGVDMQNVNALLLPGRALCVSQSGIPCTPLHPFLLGDTVFVDVNGNGVQDPGEPGIGNVEMQLLDGNGFLVATTHTDADGHYSFGVEAYPYTVVIAASNYSGEGGGTLVGYTPTTPEQCQATVTDDNVLTCDFGYRKPGAVGNRVWNDYNGNGVQDPGEPGINGVTVELIDSGGSIVASDTTNTDGNYSITNIPAGNYTVRVDDTSLPGGLTPTYDLDGIATPNETAITIVGGETRTDVDFGYQGNVSIGDRVWNDANGNGIQDPGEPGITGVKVQLLDDSGNPITTTVTGADGHYSFDHLYEGTYTVQIDTTTLPAGSTETYDLDGIDTPDAATVFVPGGTAETDVDFGYQTPVTATASIGDRVWNDVNGDGVQDANETGINGVTVQLLDVANNVVATATTSGDGNYTFSSLAAGTYTVRIVAASLPPGVAPTFDADGVGTPNAATLTLTTGESRTDVDFGYQGTASVGDRVWLDANGNGAQDLGETGLNGVTVQLLDAANNVLATTTTSGDGNYAFSNLNGGNYSVRVVAASLPPGVAETYDLDGVITPNVAAFSLTPGDSRTDLDFGYRGTASVGDRVWLDANGNGVQDAGESGINGVTVQLLDAANNVVATATTSGDGNYTFSNLTAGNYSVRVAPPAGFTPTYDLDGVATPNVAAFTLAAGASRTDVDFGYRGTASVGDRVWLDSNGNGAQDAGEAGINGVTVQLLDAANNVVATTTTSGDGNYTFNNLAGGNYTVRVSSLPAGVAETYDLDGIATANQASFTLAAGASRTDVDFGYRGTASVGDRVWLDTNANGAQDAGEAGINGVTVELLDSSNNVVASTTTSGDGNYAFNNLAGGTYTVRIVASSLPPGVAETYDLDGVATLNTATFTLAAGANRTDVDFGYRYTGSVGDRVWLDANGNGIQDAGENGINGVTVQLLDGSSNVVGTTTTSGDGNYAFNNLAAGTYTVRVSSLPAGVAETYDLDGIATANQATFTLAAGADRTDVDFGYRYTGSVGDHVWLDANANGIQDAGETGINGVTVQLLDGSSNVVGTTTTSGDGNYSFNNLAGGTYTVRVSSLPAGVTETYDLDGVATANQATFTLAAGASRTDVDFGYRYTGSVGDRVWLDTNANGAQDSGEPGLNGVTVQLLDGSSNVVGTTTTSGDGNYAFGNLAAGTYTVNVVAASLPPGVAETYDLDGAGTPNTATFNLAVGASRTDVDFGYRNTGSVGDRVWIDLNGNGVQDAGETGLNGVTVQLLDAGSNVIASTTTSGDGNYAFGNLAAGTYTVRVVSSTLPTGLTETYDLDGVATANTATFGLAAGDNRTDVDFGYQPPPPPVLDDCATPAQGDPAYNQFPSGHALYLPGIGTDFIFTPNPGGFVTHSDGTGSLQGTARSVSNPNNAFTVDIQFSGYQGLPPAGSPKKELLPNAYVENGGPVDPSTWWYYTAFTGTLTGIGNYAGAVIDVTQTGPAFQVGAGANGKNTHFGASGWFNWNVTSQPASGNLQTTGMGDVNVDLGNCPPATASVGDRIWFDSNGNGVQDAGEAGINGVTVQLLDVYGSLVATTTTSGDGNYTFSALTAGTYSVHVVASSLPAGLSPTYDLDGVATPNAATFSLSAGDTRTDVDFGYRGTGSVGDRLWNDANGNGVQDAGETGINGVTVQLVDGSNNVVATATTSGDGNYSFSNLNAGTYTVRVVAASLPAGLAPTYDLDGVATPNVATFTLAASANRTDVDFGYRGTGSIGDRVWLDANGNGIQDAGENGINGVTVQLLDSSANVVATATTSGDGNYTFSNLAGGTYTVRVVAASLPAGVAATYDLDGIATANQASFTLAAGANRTDVDFGYRYTGSVGDRVWLDANGNGTQDAGENGINGVTVQLLDSSSNVVATTTTSGDGNYAFNNLAAGTYTVRVVAASLPAGVAATYDLDGIATLNTATFSLAAGANRTDVDFGYRNTGSVGDRVWLDANGNGVQDAGETGLNGVTVQLLDSSNNVVATTTTSGDGNYSFNNLAAGTYTVKIVAASLPAGVTATYDLDGIATLNTATFTLAAGANRTDVDFGYRNTGSVGDRVWLDANGNGTQDAGETGLNGVTVQLLDSSSNVVATTTTSGDGNYSFNNLTAGTYTVRVVAASLPAGVTETYDLDGVATLNTATFTLAAGANRTDVDFGYRNTGSVGDRVWLDANGNGTQDAGETGINGVTVQLVNSGGTVIATTTTSGDGNYSFNNLAAGTYTVRIVASSLPAGVAETYDLDGIATLNTATFTLAAGANRTDVDFGYRNTGSVGDRVWLDANGNGIQDAGETGINGVTVQLLDSGSNVVATATTTGDGNYTFGNLAAGTYTVRVVAASLPAGVAATYDLDGIATANQATFTLAAGANRTDVDFGYRNTGSVGDRVWLDANGNGTQDAGETGINGVTVQLVNSGGTVIATSTTSGDGNYTFANLAAGTYTVRVVASSLPAGVAETYDLDGVATLNSAAFTLAAGANRTDVDFGYRNTGSVGDRVWLDTNGNGTQDTGEAGLNGVTVQLVNSGGTVIASTTTGGDGNYTFSNLAAGTYTVRVVASSLPAGAAETYDLDGVATANAATFTLAAGANRTDVDFGYRSVGSVGDRVWLDSNGNGIQDAGEVGLNGLTVQLLDAGGNVLATATTAGDGNYTFPNLAGGNYSVRVVNLPAGLMPTYDLDGVATPSFATFTLATGQVRTDVDFGYKINGCAIPAALDSVYGPSSGGQAFWFPGIVTDLVFTPNPGGFVINGDGTAHLTGSVRSVSDPTKGFTVDVQFSGFTTTAPSGSPKKELQSSAYSENGGPVNTATFAYFTAYTGTLTGTGSYAGAVITISRTGPAFQIGVGANGKNINFGGSGWFLWTVTSQPTSGNNLQTTGQGDINIDLDDCGTLGSVGDRVWYDTNGNGVQDSGETGMNGVTVQLLDSNGNALASAITAGDGNYTFGGRPAGTYSVKVVTTTLPAGVAPTYDLDGVATASKATFTLAAGANRTDVDFGYRGSLSIGDRVWNDANANGVQDSGEAGTNGVTVQLLNSSGTVIATTTTSGNGNYTFANLTAGTYTVKIVTSTLPAGSAETFDLDGLSSANQATVNLTASRTDVDFGYRAVGSLSIGDRVWNDANANGLQDASEVGVNGVTVQLLNSGGTVVATTTTSGNGTYSFGSLFAGTYTVRIVTTTLPGTFTETWDLDGLSTANQATVSLTASRTDVDFGYHFPVASCGGTGTLGYWKNHSDAWPVQSITIGGVTYTKAQAITWLSTPPRGDETINLFQQLVPAELNALIGNNVSCITTIIQAADAWLRQNPLGSGVSSSSTAGQAGTALQTQLDSYNNGNLSCATHRN
ncbi:MAG TPA: SdrD B-like domain-containing protein [Thermoanaerobaculia bacterium]